MANITALQTIVYHPELLYLLRESLASRTRKAYTSVERDLFIDDRRFFEHLVKEPAQLGA